MKEKKSEKNLYKTAFMVLIGLIVLSGIVFGLVSYSNNKYEEGFRAGQDVAINALLQNVAQSGSVSIQLTNGSVTLVPSQTIQIAQEQIIAEVLKRAREDGSVKLFDQKGEVTLIPSN